MIRSFFLILMALFFLNLSNGTAQERVLSGRVTSGATFLENVNVKLPALNLSAKSNPDGRYVFKQLPPGNYDIIFSAIGYRLKKQKIRIENSMQTLDMEMEQQTADLADIVITGVSRATTLKKSPVSISVLTKKSMDQQVNTNLIDAIVKGVPGISAVTTGPNVSKPFIRGLGYNRVLTLYDGLRQEGQQWGDEHGIEVDEYAISRVEVVKGPASLTYGSDALAGVINMIPDQLNIRDGALKGDFVTNYQSNNGLMASSIGLAYAKNDWKYMLRAAGKIAHNYNNPIDGYVYGTAFREYNLSVSAAVDKKWGYSKTALTYYNNFMEIPDGSRDSLTRKFTRQVSDADDNIKNRPVVPDNELRTYSINPLHQHIQHYRLYNTSRFKFRNSDLNVLIGMQQSIRREYNHPTDATQAGLYVVLNTLNYDLKYNLPDFAGVESTIGLNGMLQGNRSKDATDFPIPDYNLYDAGAFYFARKSFGKMTVSGGIRMDVRNISWTDFYVSTNKQTGFDKQEHTDFENSTLQFPAFNKNYYGLSGSVGLTYSLSEQLLFKVNIARGYRAPNITEIGSNGLDPGAHIVYLGNRTFKPEFNLQQDFGFIANMKDADLSLEVFNNHIQNYIYQSRLTDLNGNPVIIVPGNLTYQYQQSKARLYGVELSVNAHPSSLKWLNFNTSLAYVTGLNKNEELLKLHGYSARYLPFIPPLQLRSELKLTMQKVNKVIDKPYVKFDGLFVANQNRFYALDNTESFTAGYALFNVGFGTGLKSGAGKKVMDVFLQCDNVLNKAYQSNLSRLKYFEYYTVPANGRQGIYNMGRNLSFKIIVPIG